MPVPSIVYEPKEKYTNGTVEVRSFGLPGRPLPAILLILLLIATFYHTSLGLQVIIEDYVDAELVKLGLIIVVRLLCFGFAVAGIFAVLSMAMGTTS